MNKQLMTNTDSQQHTTHDRARKTPTRTTTDNKKPTQRYPADTTSNTSGLHNSGAHSKQQHQTKPQQKSSSTGANTHIINSKSIPYCKHTKHSCQCFTCELGTSSLFQSSLMDEKMEMWHVFHTFMVHIRYLCYLRLGHLRNRYISNSEKSYKKRKLKYLQLFIRIVCLDKFSRVLFT